MELGGQQEEVPTLSLPKALGRSQQEETHPASSQQEEAYTWLPQEEEGILLTGQ